MIVRVGSFTIEITGAVTHRRYQEIIKLASMTSQLRDTEQLIIENIAQQNANELRRLQEKRRRLVKRIELQKKTVNGRELT